MFTLESTGILLLKYSVDVNKTHIGRKFIPVNLFSAQILYKHTPALLVHTSHTLYVYYTVYFSWLKVLYINTGSDSDLGLASDLGLEENPSRGGYILGPHLAARLSQ